ncbi:ribosomal protein S18-alanine N-acetyltransferase [Streptomyces sp. NPDC002055]|uniref:ribosomal protein S18-alanine N-acetyltransferase n=1 Tax=Streptomyces sp. NPDC002055 TaxID=3154534 RepID=UPI00331A7F3A
MRWWDVEPVLELERELFPDDAWSRGLFWSELAHARGPSATRRYVVAEENGRVVGYGGLSAVDGTGDIQTIAAAREHWGTGLGARLLTDLLSGATAFECHEVLLEVRVDNARAQRLYERFGFEPIGLRRGYYQPGNVDALVMRRSQTADGAAAVPDLAAHDARHAHDAAAAVAAPAAHDTAPTADGPTPDGPAADDPAAHEQGTTHDG